MRGLVTVGPLQGVLTPFRDLGIQWLEMGQAATRLAFGAVLVAEATDLHDAHRKLDTLLPSVELDSGNISDFFYQVNRRRVLDLSPGTLVNRISRWSASQGGSVEFVMGGNAQPQFTRMAGHFACRLELDVNTADEYHSSPLRGVTAIALFRELVDLSKEMAEKGDIP